MPVYLYTDDEGAELLATTCPKALLISGEFGCADPGGVLPHIGTVSHFKAMSGLATISLFLLDAKFAPIEVAIFRKSHRLDALVFATSAPIDQDLGVKLGLRPVNTLGNLSCIYLYGGGHLDATCGDFILKLVAGRWQDDESRNVPPREFDSCVQTSGEQFSASDDESCRDHESAAPAHIALPNPLVRVRELSMRLQASNERLGTAGHDARHYRDQLARADADLQNALARERELSARLQAHSAQLSVVGNDVHHFLDEYSRTHAALQELSVREYELSGRMQAILSSRSWRWTRLFRAAARYFKTGRFNSAGTVGTFGALQVIGRRLPLPRSWRSHLGRVLMRFRRR